MRKDSVKRFFYSNTMASGWLVLYIVVQSFVMIGAMVYYIYHDVNFANRFLTVFEPILAIDDFWEKQTATMNGLLNVMGDRMIIILFVSSVFTILTSVSWIAWKRRKVISYIGTQEVIVYIQLGLIINILLTLFISIMPNDVKKTHECVEELATAGTIWLTIIVTGILVPITEELIFRVGVLSAMNRFNKKYAVVYQALLFGLLHGNLVQGSYAFLLGLLFGYLTNKTGNVLYAMLLHISINLSSVLVASISVNEIVALMLLSLILQISYYLYKNLLNNCISVKKRIK